MTTPVLLGGLGFGIGYLFELASWRGITWAKPILGGLSGALLVSSLALAALTGDKLELPGWLQTMGWGILVASATLLVWSLFLELPFRATYAVPGMPPALVTTGTHSLVRHPSVLWYALLLLSILLVSGAQVVLVALPVWVLMDIWWAILQEKLYLEKVFPGYKSYQRKTPMLIPNRSSLGACLRSLRP